jgi:phosphocarrier protein HPr
MAQNVHFARRQVGVTNVLGIQLRVAGRFVRLASAFQSDIKVYCKGLMVDGRSILSLLSLAAECGTMLSVEAHGADAEEAVAALAELISSESHDSEDQSGEVEGRSPKSREAQGSPREGHSTELSGSKNADHSVRSAPRWDSWRLGSTTGPRNDRRDVVRGRWLRRGSHSGG